LFRASWIADYPDAENYLALFYSKNFTPFGPNYTHFKNAAYDVLFEKALVQTDPAVRLPMYAQLDSLAMEEHPIIPLYYDKAIRFLSNNVKGLGLNPINSLELKTVRKE
jgi:ABC-type oligopeptide transport system substrate-binding subunit